MPVYSRVLRQFIGDKYSYSIALHRLDSRSGCLAIVTPALKPKAWGELTLDRFGNQVKFLDTRI